jgi:hypothetical protein
MNQALDAAGCGIQGYEADRDRRGVLCGPHLLNSFESLDSRGAANGIADSQCLFIMEKPNVKHSFVVSGLLLQDF